MFWNENVKILLKKDIKIRLNSIDICFRLLQVLFVLLLCKESRDPCTNACA